MTLMNISKSNRSLLEESEENWEQEAILYNLFCLSETDLRESVYYRHQLSHLLAIAVVNGLPKRKASDIINSMASSKNVLKAESVKLFEEIVLHIPMREFLNLESPYPSVEVH